MRRSAHARHLVLTSFGADGACAAALILQKFPKAEILFTSARRIGWTLLELAEQDPPAGVVHICGLGIQAHEEKVLEALRAFREQGAQVYWYCGRRYMDSFQDILAPLCRTVFTDCLSNTEAVHRFLGIPTDEVVRRLLDVAGVYVQPPKKTTEDQRFWLDLIESGSGRYFKYDDRSGYIHAIQKLAGLIPLSEADQLEVTSYRNGGRFSIPVGDSDALHRIRARIARMAPIDEPVLILGPTGSGKEIVARLLHEAGKRGGLFVPVNCAILSTSADLAHDRLFGHAAGAYTGAKESQIGAFETADGGTLFLDEVAELPLPVQTQLLRVLEEGAVTPLGTMKTHTVHVRIVAATNQNLPKMISDGRFRMDLYHRLNVLTLRIPPLRERPEDLEPIVRGAIYDLKKKGYPLILTPEDWQAIRDYPWPGNIRQLINILKRAAYLKLNVEEILLEEDTPPSGDGLSERSADLALFRPAAVHQVEPEETVRRAYIRHVHSLFQGNNAQTAKALKISVNTLKKWLE